MASSVFKNITCTVGATQRDGSIELMAAGMMVYVTPQTVVAPGTELSVGHKVLADYRSDRQQIGDNQGALVLRVRAYGPDEADLAKLQKLLARLAAAGVPDPGFGDAAKYLQKLFHDSLTQGTPVGSMNERLVRLLEAKGLRFPMDSWQHDIEPATSEMEEKLQSLGVTTALPRTPIEAVFEAYADEDDDQLARRHFCAAIAREANTVLEQAGKPQRWFELADLPWEDDEPFWLLVTPAQREGLLREKIFKPAKAV